MKTIPLHGKRGTGLVALIDDADYELVMAYVWHGTKQEAGNGRPRTAYAITTMRRDGVPVRPLLTMHRLIAGYAMADHADRNGLNNQRSNLRPATRSLNAANRRKQAGTRSQFKGVHPSGAKWVAVICVNGHVRRLGTFTSDQDAADAYDDAAFAAWGEYACLNRSGALEPIGRPQADEVAS